MDEYRVALAGWLNGVWREEGDTVAMTPKAAKYLLSSGQITALRPRAAARAAIPRKKRTDTRKADPASTAAS